MSVTEIYSDGTTVESKDAKSFIWKMYASREFYQRMVSLYIDLSDTVINIYAYMLHQR